VGKGGRRRGAKAGNVTLMGAASWLWLCKDGKVCASKKGGSGKEVRTTNSGSGESEDS
jgi:hypothetical protein